MPLGVLSDITGISASKIPVASIPTSLTSQVYIVTGGHAGIGLSTTRELVARGATVIIAGRNEEKCRAAIAKLVHNASISAEQLKFVQLDLQNLASAKAAGEQVVKNYERLDGIICNAGVMAVPYELTKDGIETQFQVNHLSHFLLVKALLPVLEKTGQANGRPARVVALSSFAHNFFSFFPFASPKFDSLASINRSYEPMGYIRYSQAKLSNILFVRELNKRFTNVKGIAVHPGFVASGLYDHQTLFLPLTATFITVDEGALSSLWAATSPEIDEKKLFGSYVVPFGKVKSTTAYGESSALAKELWELSDALVKERGL